MLDRNSGHLSLTDRKFKSCLDYPYENYLPRADRPEKTKRKTSKTFFSYSHRRHRMFCLPNEQLSHCHKIYIQQEFLVHIQLHTNYFPFNTYSYLVIWKRKTFLEHQRIAEWNLSMSKKYYPFLKEYIFSLSKKKEMEALQHAVEDIINMFEGITIRSKKQTSILYIYIFFIAKCFL